MKHTSKKRFNNKSIETLSTVTRENKAYFGTQLLAGPNYCGKVSKDYKRLLPEIKGSFGDWTFGNSGTSVRFMILLPGFEIFLKNIEISS